MKLPFLLPVLFSASLLLLASPGQPQVATLVRTEAPASTYELIVVWLVDTNPRKCIFTLGGTLGYSSVASLESGVASLPPGSTLRWAPSCEELGNNPLRSLTAFAALKACCTKAHVKFVYVPSG